MSSSTDSVVAKSCFAKVLIIFFSPCTKNRRAWLVHVLGYDKLGFDKPTSSCPPAEKQQAWRYCGSTFRLTIVKTNSLANQHRPDRELNRIREVALSFMGARNGAIRAPAAHEMRSARLFAYAEPVEATRPSHQGRWFRPVITDNSLQFSSGFPI